MNSTQVDLIVEGLLDEQVLRQLLAQVTPHLQARVCHGKRGRGWLGTKLVKFNQAARTYPYIVLADLELAECPPDLLRGWFPNGQHPNLQARIAVRMIEAWLLADRKALAEFFRIAELQIPQFPDQEANPKRVMVDLARRSRSRIIREDMVPHQHATGIAGRNYRGQLERFVTEKWQAERARDNSPSLRRAIHALQNFYPVIPG